MSAGKGSSIDTSVDAATVDIVVARFFAAPSHPSPLAATPREAASRRGLVVSLDFSRDDYLSDDDTRSSRSASGSHRGSVADYIRAAEVAYVTAKKAVDIARELIESKPALYDSQKKQIDTVLRRAEILQQASVKALERAEARSFTAKLTDLGSASPARRY